MMYDSTQPIDAIHRIPSNFFDGAKDTISTYEDLADLVKRVNSLMSRSSKEDRAAMKQLLTEAELTDSQLADYRKKQDSTPYTS